MKRIGYKNLRKGDEAAITGFKTTWMSIMCCLISSCTTTVINDGLDVGEELNTETPANPAEAQININAYPDRSGNITFNIKADKITIVWGDGDTEKLSPAGEETACTHRFFNNLVQNIKVKAENMTDVFFFGSGDEYTGFTELRFTNCLSLNSITASAKLLTVIEISDAPVLKKLKIAAALKSVDFINNLPALEKLQLTTDLESVTIKNRSLQEFNYWSSDTQFKSDKLKNLDVSGCPSLVQLSCDRPNLTSLNVSGCTSLQILTISGTKVALINVSTCKALTELNCTATQITSLDVSANTALEKLICSQNRLTSLNVSRNTALNYLLCSDNQLTELNVTSNKALTYLNCANNMLTALNLANCTALISLAFDSNRLSSISLANNTALLYVNCKNNNFTAAELNNLFLDLPKREISDNATITIGSNPPDESGTRSCDTSIASRKRWKVL